MTEPNASNNPKGMAPPPPSPMTTNYTLPPPPNPVPAATPVQAPPTPRQLDDATTSDDGAPKVMYRFSHRSKLPEFHYPSGPGISLHNLQQQQNTGEMASSSASFTPWDGRNFLPPQLQQQQQQQQPQPQPQQPQQQQQQQVQPSITPQYAPQQTPKTKPRMPPPPSPYNCPVPNAPANGPVSTPMAPPTPRLLDDATTSDDGAPRPMFQFKRDKRNPNIVSDYKPGVSINLLQQQQYQQYQQQVRPPPPPPQTQAQPQPQQQPQTQQIGGALNIFGLQTQPQQVPQPQQNDAQYQLLQQFQLQQQQQQQQQQQLQPQGIDGMYGGLAGSHEQMLIDLIKQQQMQILQLQQQQQQQQQQQVQQQAPKNDLLWGAAPTASDLLGGSVAGGYPLQQFLQLQQQQQQQVHQQTPKNELLWGGGMAGMPQSAPLGIVDPNTMNLIALQQSQHVQQQQQQQQHPVQQQQQIQSPQGAQHQTSPMCQIQQNPAQIAMITHKSEDEIMAGPTSKNAESLYVLKPDPNVPGADSIPNIPPQSRVTESRKRRARKLKKHSAATATGADAGAASRFYSSSGESSESESDSVAERSARKRRKCQNSKESSDEYSSSDSGSGSGSSASDSGSDSSDMSDSDERGHHSKKRSRKHKRSEKRRKEERRSSKSKNKKKKSEKKKKGGDAAMAAQMFDAFLSILKGSSSAQKLSAAATSSTTASQQQQQQQQQSLNPMNLFFPAQQSFLQQQQQQTNGGKFDSPPYLYFLNPAGESFQITKALFKVGEGIENDHVLKTSMGVSKGTLFEVLSVQGSASVVVKPSPAIYATINETHVDSPTRIYSGTNLVFTSETASIHYTFLATSAPFSSKELKSGDPRALIEAHCDTIIMTQMSPQKVSSNPSSSSSSSSSSGSSAPPSGSSMFSTISCIGPKDRRGQPANLAPAAVITTAVSTTAAVERPGFGGKNPLEVYFSLGKSKTQEQVLDKLLGASERLQIEKLNEEMDCEQEAKNALSAIVPQQPPSSSSSSSSSSLVEPSGEGAEPKAASKFDRLFTKAEDIKETLDDCGYYVDSNVKKLLLNSTYLHMTKNEFTKSLRGSSFMPNVIHLNGATASEQCVEAIGRAVAKQYNADLITITCKDIETLILSQAAPQQQQQQKQPFQSLSVRPEERASAEDMYAKGAVFMYTAGKGVPPRHEVCGAKPPSPVRCTVVYRISESKDYVGVEFDKPFPGGTDLGGLCRAGRGWFVRARELEPLRDAEREDNDGISNGSGSGGENDSEGGSASAAKDKFRPWLLSKVNAGTPLVILIRGIDAIYRQSFRVQEALASILLTHKTSSSLVIFGLSTFKLPDEANNSANGLSGSGGGVGGTEAAFVSSLASRHPRAIVKARVDNQALKAQQALENDVRVSTLIENAFPLRIEVVPPPAGSPEYAQWVERLARDAEETRLRKNVELVNSVFALTKAHIAEVPSSETPTMIIDDDGDNNNNNNNNIENNNNNDNNKNEINSNVLFHKLENIQALHDTALSEDTVSRAAAFAISECLRAGEGSESGAAEQFSVSVESFARGLSVAQSVLPAKARSRLANFVTSNTYERALLSEVITPEEASVNFSDIGALEDVKRTLYETVILPLQRPELFRRGNLARPTKGVLLFGLPGTGKTMIARAVATECGANFLNVSISSITSKWFGESEKYAKAIFSLAAKIAPTVIFIDEVDSLLSSRGKRYEHESSRKVKNEFMAAWDGLRTSQTERVLVLATTNRPMDLDDAVLRRLSRRILVDLPDAPNREKILRVLLRDEALAQDFDYADLARRTDGYSGSDLKNLCIAAALHPVRELLKGEEEERERLKREAEMVASMGSEEKMCMSPVNVEKTKECEGESAEGYRGNGNGGKLRMLTNEDFAEALKEVSKSVSEDTPTMSELRQWNKEFGECGERNNASYLNYYS